MLACRAHGDEASVPDHAVHAGRSGYDDATTTTRLGPVGDEHNLAGPRRGVDDLGLAPRPASPVALGVDAADGAIPCTARLEAESGGRRADHYALAAAGDDVCGVRAPVGPGRRLRYRGEAGVVEPPDEAGDVLGAAWAALRVDERVHVDQRD